jgi:opacity protein-like surface antigen
MKGRKLIRLTLLVSVCAALGGCRHGSGIELGAFGSSLKSEDLGQGYGGGAKLELNPIDWISLDGRASYVRFADTRINMVPLEAAALLNFSMAGERIVPYVGAGVGYYLFEAEGSDLDNKVGFFPLAGLEIGLWRVSFLAEVRWLFLQTDVESTRGELRNLREAEVDGLGINLGVLFRF